MDSFLGGEFSTYGADVIRMTGLEVQGDQLNMAVRFWYFVKSGLSSVRVNSRVQWTSNFLQFTKKHGHICLVGLYKATFII